MRFCFIDSEEIRKKSEKFLGKDIGRRPHTKAQRNSIQHSVLISFLKVCIPMLMSVISACLIYLLESGEAGQCGYKLANVSLKHMHKLRKQRI